MSNETVSQTLILASGSPYRATLLERFGIRFQVIAPDIDETPAEGEQAHELVSRLAVQKASSVAELRPDAVVIGSDQLAVHGSRIFGKPGSAEKAREQLASFSGQTVSFLSAVAVVRQATELVGYSVVQTQVKFRSLTSEEISRYVSIDSPIDCAGSFRAERMGLTLFESMFSQDPTAIIGIPLIETARLLREAGYELP